MGSMYYSKCHGELPLPGIFRFPANCHAPSVDTPSPLSGADRFQEG
jgi:hypothetical protein